MWFLTIRGNEGLAWLVLPPELDERLSVDARLAWRTAATWAAIGVTDVEQMLAVEDYLRLVPPGPSRSLPVAVRQGLDARCRSGRATPTSREGARRRR